MKKTILGIGLALGLILGARANIEIYELYGAGGNAGASYKNDFVILLNNGASSVTATGWSLQYASSTGSSWSVANLSTFTLQSGQYYLIQLAGGSNGSAIPLSADQSFSTINMSGTAGKLALVTSTTSLSGTNPSGGGTISDFVGFGSGTNGFEGTGPAPAPSTTNSITRINYADGNNNATDFAAGTPTFYNSASTFASVPEPRHYGIAIAALLGVVVVVRRRQKTLTA